MYHHEKNRLKDSNIQNEFNKKLKNYFINDEVGSTLGNSSSMYRENFTFEEIADVLHIKVGGESGFSVFKRMGS